MAFVTFLTMYLNTSLPSPLFLPPCCSSDGPEVADHRSRAHQDYEWASQPIALRKSSLVAGAQFFWMENNNRGRLEQAWGLSTSSCLGKACTAEIAILKGDNEHANLLQALHQTSESSSHPRTRPILLSPTFHTLLGPLRDP